MIQCGVPDTRLPKMRATACPAMPDSNNTGLSETRAETPVTIAHYRIVKILGKGGMGEVFLAEDTSQPGRRVALKVLAPDLTKDESRLRRFKQEARAILALNHPNILTIFEIGQTDTAHYIATEFIEGETLRHCLWRNQIKVDEASNRYLSLAHSR
jgi:serine/threonine protein kinase